MARISRRCGWEELAMPVASMVNIILLLVIFFIVAEAIDRESGDESINVPSVHSEKSFSRKDPRSMTVNIRRDGTVNIGLVDLSMEELKTELREAIDTWGPDLPVVIRGDRELKLSAVRDVVSAVAASGVRNIVLNSVVTQGRESKNEKK